MKRWMTIKHPGGKVLRYESNQEARGIWVTDGNIDKYYVPLRNPNETTQFLNRRVMRDFLRSIGVQGRIQSHNFGE